MTMAASKMVHSRPFAAENHDAIGKDHLSKKVVNSLSAILRGQFKLEYGGFIFAGSQS